MRSSASRLSLRTLNLLFIHSSTPKFAFPSTTNHYADPDSSYGFRQQHRKTPVSISVVHAFIATAESASLSLLFDSATLHDPIWLLRVSPAPASSSLPHRHKTSSQKIAASGRSQQPASPPEFDLSTRPLCAIVLLQKRPVNEVLKTLPTAAAPSLESDDDRASANKTG